MAPPELARDTPVVDVLDPVEIGVLPALRMEGRVALAHRRDRRVGHRAHARTNHWSESIGSTTVSQREQTPIACLCGSIFSSRPARFEILDDLACAHSSRVIPRYAPPFWLICAVRIHHRNLREVVTLAHLEVVEVMPGRDFDRAGAECAIDRGVGDDRDLATRSAAGEHLADVRLVALVIRMHRDGGVAEHRLRPRRRDGHRAGAVGERIADVPEVPGASPCDRLRGRRAPSRIADTS